MLARLLFPLLLTASLAAEDFVPRMAGEARLFLRVPDHAAPLKSLQISSGESSPGDFEADPEKRARLTAIRFPVSWWHWKEVTVRFTPAHDGTLELDLNGPWGEGGPGQLLRQEILWDELSAEGAELENGGFEDQEDGHPTGWESPWRPYPAAESWPLAGSEPPAGRHCAASWHGRPLTGSLAVRAGIPVSLKLRARAATVPGFKPPTAMPADTPAHRACARLKRGVNLGNQWDTEPGQWSIRHEPGDIDRIAREGFDHIRVPVAWHFHLDDGTIRPALLAGLEPILRHALKLGLTVVLDWHSFEALCHDPERHRAQFLAGWESVARHFKDWPPQLYLELFNEPNGALDGATLTEIHAAAIHRIRTIDSKRILVVNPPQWAAIGGLDRLFLPENDQRIIVSVHSYEPFEFTHQQASWVKLGDLRDVTYPGPPPRPLAVPDSLREHPGLAGWLDAYNTRPPAENPCGPAAIEARLDEALAWSRRFGRPIHIGEFGVYQKAPATSRARYLRDFRRAAEARRLPWAMWDWKAGFGYWDEASGQPLLREALFGD
jgi:endoglucanase